MAAPATAAPVKDDGFSDKLEKADSTTLGRLMRVCNGLNACLLIAVGVVAFITLSLSAIIVLSALYVIMFSCLLCIFECCSRRFLTVFRSNFGFMFKWQGRLIFFIFTGTLCFGLGIFGIISGSITIVNVFFNIYVMCKNPAYQNELGREQSELATRPSTTGAPAAGNAAVANPYAQPAAQGANSNPFSVDVTLGAGGRSVTVPVSASDVVAVATVAAQTTAGGKPLPAGWEKVYDEGTKRYYYFNPKTQESRWDLD